MKPCKGVWIFILLFSKKNYDLNKNPNALWRAFGAP